MAYAGFLDGVGLNPNSFYKLFSQSGYFISKNISSKPWALLVSGLVLTVGRNYLLEEVYLLLFFIAFSL